MFKLGNGTVIALKSAGSDQEPRHNNKGHFIPLYFGDGQINRSGNRVALSFSSELYIIRKSRSIDFKSSINVLMNVCSTCFFDLLFF